MKFRAKKNGSPFGLESYCFYIKDKEYIGCMDGEKLKIKFELIQFEQTKFEKSWFYCKRDDFYSEKELHSLKFNEKIEDILNEKK